MAFKEYTKLIADLASYPPKDKRLLPLAQCSRCDKLSPFRNGVAKQVVLPDGNLETARFLVIGQSPGATEDLHGYNLCGPYHSLIEALGRRGVKLGTNLVVANALWCHPEKNRGATTGELKHCRHNLSQLIAKMPYLNGQKGIGLVILVGADALALVEPKESKLKLRKGNPGFIEEWIGDDHTGTFQFFTYPIPHPAGLDKIDNEAGKARAKTEFAAYLEWIKEAAVLIQSDVDLRHKLPYKFNVALTEHDWIAFADKVMTAKEFVIDFETWALGYHTEAVGFAIATGRWESYYFPLKRCVPLPKSEWEYVKGKGGKSTLMKFGLVDFFPEKSSAVLMNYLRPLFEAPDRPFPSAQHAKIEMTCLKEYGISLRPRPEQTDLEMVNLVRPFDTMVLARNVMQQNRVNLETILQLALPLEWSRKSKIEICLTENEVFTTGYGLLSRPPADLTSLWLTADEGHQPSEEDRDTWIPKLGQYKFAVLAERAMLDSCWEFALPEILREMAEDPDDSPLGSVNLEQLLYWHGNDE